MSKFPKGTTHGAGGSVPLDTPNGALEPGPALPAAPAVGRFKNDKHVRSIPVDKSKHILLSSSDAPRFIRTVAVTTQSLHAIIRKAAKTTAELQRLERELSRLLERTLRSLE